MVKKLYSSVLMLVLAGGLLAQTNGLVSTFENIALNSNSYWNGSDMSGGFESGQAWFGNSYNAAWGAWNGWAVSNVTDKTTAGYMNQYSAITGSGYDTVASNGANYAVTYVSGQSVIKVNEPLQHKIKGFYITNSTYAALSMEQGDAYSKKFGGASGTDPDWFKLTITAMRNGSEWATTDFYLADFRSDNASEDYILKTWEWVNLESLGKVDSLLFSLSSSDNGDWGMNTPAYFCIDNFTVITDEAPEVTSPIADITAKADAENQNIDLSTVFSDVDTEASLITYFVEENTGAAMVSSTIDGKNLVLDFISEGTATIVVGALADGLVAYDTIEVTVTPVLAVTDVTENQLSVYPNPSNGQFSIAGLADEVATITVFNALGKVVLHAGMVPNNGNIDISDQPNGLYIISAEGKNVTTTIKIMKQ